MKKIKKAVIPAAGLGTRFLPFTKSIPKEMLPIVDKPTIQYLIEEIASCGIEDILIITGRNKVVIIDHFDNTPELEFNLERAGKTEEIKLIEGITQLANIFTIRQKERKGLGHAIYCAKEFVGDEPFAVVLGDDVIYNPQKPALEQLIDVYDKVEETVVGVEPVPWDEINKYGIVELKKNSPEGLKEIQAYVEKPPLGSVPSNLAIVGRYIITPEIFDILEKTPPGSGGEIQLTDALETLLKEEPAYACELVGRRYDLGSKIGFLQATVEYGLRNEALSEQFSVYLNNLSEILDGEDVLSYLRDPSHKF